MRQHPRTLHLSHDNRFVSAFSRQLYQLAPASATYVILADDGQLRFPVSGDTRVVTTTQAARDLILALLPEFDAVIVHYMFPAWGEIVPVVSRSVPVVWSGFGGDYYGHTFDENAGLLGAETRKLKKFARGQETLPGKIHRLWSRRGHHKTLVAAAAATAYFSAPVSADLAIMSSRFPSFSGQYLPLSYATVEDMTPPAIASRGENILIGNSATLTNNHLDVFSKLKKVDLDGRKLIVPLSYGEGSGYQEAVLSAGKKAFGASFRPILDPLPLEEYNAMLASCAFVAMGHLRQQGLGNLITALLSGSTLILEPRNPVTLSFSEIGIKVANFDELVRDGLGGIKLTESQLATNRSLAEDHWSVSAVSQRVQRLLSALSRDSVPDSDR